MSNKAEKGQIITLGQYPQSDITGAKKDPIEWKVLAVEGDKALVVSLKGLDNVMFHKQNMSVNWAKSDLRAWLNGEFLDAAFSKEEQAKIRITVNDIPDSTVHGAPGCADTEDKIFCLSIAQAQELFASDEDRTCAATAYAKAKGAFVHASNGNCWWWLRNPGYYPSDSAGINYYGYVHVSGDNVTSPSDAVRPAMWIAL